MSRPYLEVTYRQGKPFAAYLYLDRQPGDKGVRTQRHGSAVIDFGADGRIIGVEFTTVAAIDLAILNQLLAANGQAVISGSDLAPLRAA